MSFKQVGPSEKQLDQQLVADMNLRPELKGLLGQLDIFNLEDLVDFIVYNRGDLAAWESKKIPGLKPFASCSDEIDREVSRSKLAMDTLAKAGFFPEESTATVTVVQQPAQVPLTVELQNAARQAAKRAGNNLIRWATAADVVSQPNTNGKK